MQDKKCEKCTGAKPDFTRVQKMQCEKCGKRFIIPYTEASAHGMCQTCFEENWDFDFPDPTQEEW
jgi:hypothetical protein